MSRRRRRAQAAGGAPAGWADRFRFSPWMLLLALTAPLGYAAFHAFTGDDSSLRAFSEAVLWPGAPIYAIAVVVVWAGWALELE